MSRLRSARSRPVIRFIIRKDAPVAPSNVGQASMPDYAKLRGQAVRSLPDGGKVFAAPRRSPASARFARSAQW